jgi:predicted component of type VI protein secretion system
MYFMQNDKGYTWRVIKSNKRYNKSKPHKLQRGDVMKLGRYIFEVKEISSNKEDFKEKDPRFAFTPNIL